MTPLINNILFGRFRPWIPDGFQELVRDAEVSFTQHIGGSISLLSCVELPAAFDKNTTVYAELIEQEMLLLHLDILHKTAGLEGERDKFLRLTQHIDELWELLEEISKLVKDPPFDAGDERKAKTAEFVLNVAELLVVNLAVDLGLRCTFLDRGFTFSLEQLYLITLDRPPPDPSPFCYTVEWYKLRLKNVFEELSADQSLTVDRKQHIVSILEGLGKEFDNDQNSFNSFDVQQLVHHAEDALFLVMMNASFLKNDGGRLVDPDYCRDWVMGMRQDILFGNSEVDATAFLQKIDRTGSELRLIMKPVSGPFSGLAMSAAARWISEWEALKQTDGDMPPMVHDGDTDTGYNSVDFATYFNSRYIHRQELAAVMNVDRRTVERYLDEGNVRKMELSNNNIWYLWEDVEQFFDDNTNSSEQ